MKPLTRSITCVFGQTGTGKSQYTKHEIKKHKRVVIIDPQNEYAGIQQFDNLDDLFNHIEKNKIFRCAYSDLRDFDLVCEAVTYVPDTLLVVEESQRIIPPLTRLPEAFENIIYRGRHSGTSVHLVAQRPTTVDIAVRSQFNRLITFRQSEKRDISWITDVSGYELEDEIRNLQVLEYIEIDNEGYRKDKLKGFLK